MQSLIQVSEVSKIYYGGENTLHALDKVNLEINAGEYIAIVGSSGSGKSTLMNILGCLDTPDSGKYLMDGKDSSTFSEDKLSDLRNKHIGFIFQSFNLIPTLTAIENVELPLLYRKLSADKRNHLALQALDKVALLDRIKHYPSQLSGGQQQRVAIARAIAASPDIILADEPTGNLDRTASMQIIRILKDLHCQGKTIILITHDDHVAQQAERIIRLQDGKIVNDSKPH
ncbi:MAG: ABC transporter ATP-binding protein [Oscillospiraceae bacterium]